MKAFLLLDFGTTRLKSALTDLDSGQIVHTKALDHLPSVAVNPARHEISPLQLKAQFIELAEEYYEKASGQLAGIMLCSQMNGYMLLDERDLPLSNYITWKDERSLEPVAGLASFELLRQRTGDAFRQITGTKLRPSFPVANLLHMLRCGEIRQNCRAVSIPEWLTLVSGKSENKIHPTMMANFGVYDIYKQQLSPKIIGVLEEYGPGLIQFNSIGSEEDPCGYWQAPKGEWIPIYCGVGDHQCTILGAGLVSETALSINLGTGSQVAMIAKECEPKMVEQRPYFGGDLLAAITHIPAGRVLEEQIAFLSDVGKLGGASPKDYWRALQSIGPKEILSADLEFDLALFQSAWGYQQGGVIRRIREGNWRLESFMAGMLRSFCLQYKRAAAYIDPHHQAAECILSSGVARQLPQLVFVLEELLERQVILCQGEEEPFIGLRTLALVAAGKVSDYRKARQLFSASK